MGSRDDLQTCLLYTSEPVMVECIHFHPELRYTQAELEQYLPQISEESAAPAGPSAKGTQQGLALVLKRCDFIRHCRDNGATLPEHDWYAMITNLAVFEGGERAIHEPVSYTHLDVYKRQIKHSAPCRRSNGRSYCLTSGMLGRMGKLQPEWR